MKPFKDLLKGGSSVHGIQMLVDASFPLVVWFSSRPLWLLQTKDLNTFILILSVILSVILTSASDEMILRYYQWVVFVLFLQAAMFHIPRIIWKHCEGGLMKMLVGDLTNPLMLINKEERMERVLFIKKYFKESTKSHGGYAINFFLCEILAFVNVIGQIYFTDK